MGTTVSAMVQGLAPGSILHTANYGPHENQGHLTVGPITLIVGGTSDVERLRADRDALAAIAREALRLRDSLLASVVEFENAEREAADMAEDQAWFDAKAEVQ